LFGFAAGYYGSSSFITSKETEKIVITEKGKKTTIYRKKNIKTPTPPRKWHGRLLIDPSRPENSKIGLGYRLFPNVSLEGSYGPKRGEFLFGVGVFF
jgi:hypothetical protein